MGNSSRNLYKQGRSGSKQGFLGLEQQQLHRYGLIPAFFLTAKVTLQTVYNDKENVINYQCINMIVQLKSITSLVHWLAIIFINPIDPISLASRDIGGRGRGSRTCYYSDCYHLLVTLLMSQTRPSVWCGWMSYLSGLKASRNVERGLSGSSTFCQRQTHLADWYTNKICTLMHSLFWSGVDAFQQSQFLLRFHVILESKNPYHRQNTFKHPQIPFTQCLPSELMSFRHYVFNIWRSTHKRITKERKSLRRQKKKRLCVCVCMIFLPEKGSFIL